MEAAGGMVYRTVGRYDMALIALFFLCGILASAILLPGRAVLLGSLLLSAGLVFINRRNTVRLKWALLLVVFLMGMLLYGIASGGEGSLEPVEGKKAVFECLIIDEPVQRGGGMQYTAETHYVQYQGKSYNFRERIFIRTTGGHTFGFGDTIRVEGQCDTLDGIRNPGDFDYGLYYRSKGIRRVLTAYDTMLLKQDSAGSLRTMLYLSREKVEDMIYSALPQEEASILVWIITGDKSEIDEETKAAYTKTGLSHILSVSGLHVGFLMLLVSQLLMPFKLEKGIKSAVSLLIVVYYVLLIGAPLPAVRALIMLCVLMAGTAAGRSYDLLASVSFAAVAILLFKPMSIHDPGFMISFAAMYSIALLYPTIYSLLRRAPGAIRGSAALSFSVWLGLAPVLTYYFNYISVISLVLNIAAIPLSFLITIAGFCGILAGIISKAAAMYIFSVDYYLVSLLTFITKKASELPLAGFQLPSLPIYMYLLFYLGVALLYAFFQKDLVRIYISRFLVGYMLLAAVLLMFYNLPSKELKMVFLDVGQGDSCCIITPDRRAVLVDGGGSSGKGEYYYDVGGKITLPALLHQGIWSIDTVIVSHMHDDHMEGLLKVIEAYPVNNLIIPRVSAGKADVSPSRDALLELCSRKGIKIHRLGQGDRLSLGRGVSIDFLLPGEAADPDENQNSLVGRLSYGSFSALLTGDMGSSLEEKLSQGLIRSSVLKVPHHGSGGSSSVGFLKEAAPQVSIVSVGRNNFGHPSPAAMERLVEASSLVYRTDRSGAVTVTTDGHKLKVWTVK